jgi:outer membrane murein-binding lipoprotein Lpp
MSLNPVIYEWKDPSRGTGIKAGFVAQQVEKVFPQAVVSAGTGIKGVDPNAINALLVKAVQELSAKVDKLQAEIELLKTKK